MYVVSVTIKTLFFYHSVLLNELKNNFAHKYDFWLSCAVVPYSHVNSIEKPEKHPDRICIDCANTAFYIGISGNY